MDFSKQSPIPTTKSLISSETRRKYEEKVCKYKYKLNKQINRNEELSNQLKKLEAAYEALKLEMESKKKFVVRIVVHGEEGENWNEFKFDSFEKQHPAFQRYIKNRIENGERKTIIDMTDKEGEVREMFDFVKGEELEHSDKKLACDLIKTLEEETEYRDCGHEWWEDGIYYTIEMDFSGFGY